MLERLSVKKPYTVIVGVILAIVLGVVSFTSMRTDLLPSIDLPYVVVYTTYVGASPEQVENTVTRPMEQALASTTDLKSVQSVSSENVSMVILEYEDDANMDTALIEISSAVSQIEGGWSDSVGSPVVMKLNPDMMPVMISSVDYEGKDIYELSDYVENTLMTDLEGINGVASVEKYGMIEQEITVTIRQSRIDAINNLILRDVDAELADVEQQLRDAQEQLNEGKHKLAGAKHDAMGQLDGMIAQLEAGKTQLPDTIAQLEAQRAQLISQREELLAQREQLVAGIAQLEAAQNGVNLTPQQEAQIKLLEQSLTAMERERDLLIAQRDAMDHRGAPTQEELDAQQKLVGELTKAVNRNEKTIAEQLAYIADLNSGTDVQQEVNGLQAEIVGLQTVNLAAQSTIAVNQGVIDTLQKQIDSQRKQVADLDEQIAAAGLPSGNTEPLEAKKNQLSGEAGELEAAVSAKQQDVQAWNAQIGTIDEQLANADQLSEAETSALSAQREQLNGSIAEAETEIAEKNRQLEEKRAQIAELEKQIADANRPDSAVSELETRRSSILADIAASEKNIAELTQQNVGLRSSIGENEKAISEKQAKATELLNSVLSEQDRAKLESAVELMQKAQEELAVNQEKLRTEGIKLAEMRAAQGLVSKEELQKQIDGLNQQIDGIKNSEEYQMYLMYKQLQQNPGGLETQLAELKDALNQLDSGLTQINAGIAQMDTMLDKLKKGVIPGGMVEGMDEDTNIADAIDQLKDARKMAVSQFAKAESAIADGAQQLAEGRKEFEDARDEALENAKIDSLINMQLVAQILGAQNMSMPAGYVSDEAEQYLVRVGDKFRSVDELKNLVLFNMGLDSVDEVRLVDIATVEITDNSEDVFSIVNGEPAVTLSYSKQSTASTTEVSQNIQKAYAKLTARDSKLHFTNLMDQGVYINLIIDSVMQSLIFGGILAVVILAIFLADLRPTIIVACSIPLSVVAAIVCMYFSNITLNIISLSGLSLAIGMLVDNSIVVIDNIYRLRNEEHMPIFKACVKGVETVSGALFSSTLTTICVWMPIVFVSGMVRQLFQDLALTIGYALLASLLVAMTLVPCMGSVLMKRPQRGKHRILRAVQNAYAGALRVCLRFKLPVLALAVGLLVYAAMQAAAMGLTLFPSMSSNQMTVSLVMPEDAEKEEVQKACYELTDAFLTVEGVDTIGVMDSSSSMGSLMGGGGSGNSQSLYVVLDEESGLTSKDITGGLMKKAEEAGYEISISESMMDMSALSGSGMQVDIKGIDMDVLTQIAADVADMMGEIEGTTEVDSGAEKTVPQLSVIMDREKASQYNLTVGQVMQSVAMALNTGSTVTQMTIGGKEMDVVVVEGENLERTPEDIGDISMKVSTKDGEEEILVSDICDISYTSSQQSIRRSDQRRVLHVTCGVDDAHNVALLGRELQEKLAAYDTPEGYSLTVSGENETINNMMFDMIKMIALAIVMIVLVMVAQFQSFKSPFIVLFTIPLAFTGGLLALQLMHMELGITGMVGFLVLSGVVVNNGIVFVDSVNQMRAEGMAKREALIETGRIRLRPILMTALTTILGMLPMAMATGMGSEMMQGMAVVTIGGLAYATLMTLFVVPVLYDIFNGKKYVVRKIEDEE